VEVPTLASPVQSPEAASHMWASGRPLFGLVAKNYIQAIVEQIRYTSCVLQNKVQNVTSTYREKSFILGLEVCIILVLLLLLLSLLSLVLRLLPPVLQFFPQN
jgi:tetrahydromethanopterin S-methyltransferase subunit F